MVILLRKHYQISQRTLLMRIGLALSINGPMRETRFVTRYATNNSFCTHIYCIICNTYIHFLYIENMSNEQGKPRSCQASPKDWIHVLCCLFQQTCKNSKYLTCSPMPIASGQYICSRNITISYIL